MTLGENIVKQREVIKVSQTELAKMAGVDVTMLSAIESGARENLTLRTICKIAAALGVSASALLGGVDTRKLFSGNPKD